VLFDRRYAEHATITLRIAQDVSKERRVDGQLTGSVRAVPVHLAAERRPYGLIAVMPERAAAAAGLRTVPLGSYYTTSAMPSGSQRQALTSDLAQLGTDARTYLEQGYGSRNSLVVLALTVFAGLVTIGAAGIATGLSQADAEPDLKTLAAIGAAPGVRRRLSGFQCGVVAVMGVVLGSLAGVLPAVGLRRAELRLEWTLYHQAIDNGWGWGSQVPHVPIVLPWATLAMLLIAVPLGATLLAALVTRSRAQVARRAAS
jgi:putative ABC transport system permease protein